MANKLKDLEMSSENNTTGETKAETTSSAANQNTTTKKDETLTTSKTMSTPSKTATNKGTTSAKKTAKKKTKRRSTKKTTAAGSKKTAANTRKKTTAKKAGSTKKTTTAKRQSNNPKEDIMTKATNKQFEQMTQQAYSGFEEAASFGKEFFDALTQSCNIATTGYQELVKQGMSASQETTEATVAAMKDMMTCRSLNELTEKQGQFAKTTMDKTLSTASDFTEKYVKLCTDCSEPLNKKITAAVDKASKKAA